MTEGSGPMASRKPMGGAFLLLGASSAIATVATLVSGIILAHLLSVEERGLVALLIYWSNLAAALGGLSLPDAFIFSGRTSEGALAERLSTMLVTISGVSLVVVGVSAAGVNLFAERFAGVPTAFAAAVIGAFILINNGNGAFISVERSRLSFARLAAERVVQPLSYSLLLVAAAVVGIMSVQTALIIFLVSRVPVMAYRIWQYRHYIAWPIDRGFAKHGLRNGVRFHAVAVVRFFNEQGDNFVVNLQWATMNIGYFAVGYSAAGAAYSLISQALGMTTLPIAAKLRDDEVADHLAQSLRITSLLMAAMMIPIVVLAPVVVPFVFGAKFGPAAEMTQILAVALLLGPLIAQVDAVLRARGLARAALRMQFIVLSIFAAGWAVFGYGDIYSLGLMLAISRSAALVATLRLARADLGGLRLRDCFLWRMSDVRTIWASVAAATSRIIPKRHRSAPPGDGTGG